jgi:hypothetical protein
LYWFISRAFATAEVWKGLGKKGILRYKVLFEHLPGGSEENHENIR